MRRHDREIKRELHSTYGTFFCRTMTEMSFDDVEEMIQVADKHRNYRHFDRYWAGASVEEMGKMAREGSPRMLETMLGMMDQIHLPDDFIRPEMSRRRRRVKSDFGNELDIHAVNQGRADRAWDMTHVERVATTGNRLIHLMVDLSASAGVDFLDGLWRGAATMRIYEALVRLNKSIAISAYYSACKGWKHGDSMMSVRLKNYGEPIREDRLAAFSSIQFLRTVVFGAMHGCGIPESDGLGGPISDFNLMTHYAEEDLQHGGAVFVVGQAFTRDMAQKTVEKFIAQYVEEEAEVEGFTGREQIAIWAGG